MQQDTRTLLRTGVTTLLVGLIAAALMDFAFGGVSRQGPHTNAGWLALIIALGCLPTGTLTLLLAVLKLSGDRKKS